MVRTIVNRRAQPFVFFFLHACTAWPIGVVGIALSNSLVKAGVSVSHVSAIIAATSLAFTLEFVWAPMVDASLTRKTWFVAGTVIMCGGLFTMFVIPWNQDMVSLLTLLGFASCSGAALAAATVKGIMAYDVPAVRHGEASGFYAAGGIFAKAVGGSATLFLFTHLSGKFTTASLSVGTAALMGSAILLASPELSAPIRAMWPRLRASLLDLWNFIRTREGILVAVLCVIPFGAGTEAGLMGAIAREWAVSSNQLALFVVLGAATNIGGAIFAGWLSTRIGPWMTYIVFGWTMIVVMIVFAFTPRAPVFFFSLELFYRALSSGCATALLGIVLTAINKGAASTKAATLWSLANFSNFYPTLIEGAVHDRGGTAGMLLTDAGLGAVGFCVLVVALRLFRSAANVKAGSIPASLFGK